ncbi:initiation control protein YabA, partial [Staphylococcus hominis]
PLPSKDNLAVLYSEGFHICNGELFGKHRYGETFFSSFIWI